MRNIEVTGIIFYLCAVVLMSACGKEPVHDNAPATRRGDHLPLALPQNASGSPKVKLTAQRHVKNPQISPTQNNDTPENAEKAKAALIELIRTKNSFWGNPDPNRLEKIEITRIDNGLYALGAFQINILKFQYFCEVNQPSTRWVYHGTFTVNSDGSWTAGTPETQHFSHLDPKRLEKSPYTGQSTVGNSP